MSQGNFFCAPSIGVQTLRWAFATGEGLRAYLGKFAALGSAPVPLFSNLVVWQEMKYIHRNPAQLKWQLPETAELKKGCLPYQNQDNTRNKYRSENQLVVSGQPIGQVNIKIVLLRIGVLPGYPGQGTIPFIN